MPRPLTPIHPPRLSVDPDMQRPPPVPTTREVAADVTVLAEALEAALDATATPKRKQDALGAVRARLATIRDRRNGERGE